MIRKLFSSVITPIMILMPLLGIGASSGIVAAATSMPDDMQLVNEFYLAKYDLTYQRYQQFFGQAKVLGGQLTQYLDQSGSQVALIGAHYPDISASNAIGFSKAAANGIVDRQIGAAGNRQVDLMINPANGRYFYWVETLRADSRWVFWIDAASGSVVNKYNALAHSCDGIPAPCGFGVAYDDGDTTDIKDLSNVTTQDGSTYILKSPDGRQETYDQGSSRKPFLGPIAEDDDNSWIIRGDESPAQGALIDAQYYAYVTDKYFTENHGYDWVVEAAKSASLSSMVVHAHYTKDYNNAFWNGRYVGIGDGDQSSFRELTPLDVVAHEFTHGVTDFTSDLIYQNESGALNEAFSDMMGNSAEFFAEYHPDGNLEPAQSLEPDMYVGEDLDLRGDTDPGFRNMEDPTEDGDPSHYADRYTGSNDNGGVHTNSGIANHWYYLLALGGQNADPNRASGTDVDGIGLTNAEGIAFLGFTALANDADFCDARDATLAIAGNYQSNVANAWDEVGVDDALCNSTITNSPTADFTYSVKVLTVDFTDNSSDEDGNIVERYWEFGDSYSSTSYDLNPSFTYADYGSYTVSLTVTDDQGATDTTTTSVQVAAELTGFNLSATGYKVKGIKHVDLTWSGANSADVDVYRDGGMIITIPNSDSYTDNINSRGGGSYTYYLCEAGTTSTCSNEVTITY
jgi:Zn-dependent metalloprotease